jgi:hypothetical protein
VRPAVQTDYLGGGTRVCVSASVQARRTGGAGGVGGRDLRQTFYRQELPAGAVPVAGFTNDFRSLASLDHRPNEGLAVPRNLDDKIAVFYADGNGFGSLQSACDSPEALNAWDRSLRDRRRALLSRLLAQAQALRHWRTAAGHIRLETLMWGGDELTFVVPAWCGLELAALFFELTADWRYPDVDTGQPLCHAAALVFAHAKAPIRRLELLAHDLVEQTKRDGDKARNTLAWVVLESFDHTGSDLGDYLQRRYPLNPCPVDWARLRLGADQLHTLRADLPPLREVLPRSAIVRALRLLVSGRLRATGGEFHPLLLRSYDSVKRAVAQAGEDKRWLRLWQALAPGRPWTPTTPSLTDIAPWTLLLELWDYTLPTLPAPVPVALVEDAA